MYDLLDYLETLMMGHTSGPKMLAPDQTMMVCKNPKMFIQLLNLLTNNFNLLLIPQYYA
jgi:hypothetical protein